MPSGNVPTTPTTPTSPSAVAPSQGELCTSKMQRQMSYDPTEYVQRARVTKAAPPKPAANPLQFVQIKPCNLYQSAQEQLKRAEEVKKVKEIVKEEPEDWQSNLDNWKSGRRKRVEHIIDRVVEAKKLEMEEFDRNRKKSKTFSEMMEERESKGRKCSLPVYNDDDDASDFNGFGYRTNDTISGKSSVSEDYENQSVNSDNTLDSDKNRFIDSNSNNESYRRDSESSPGFDDNTSNSTLSAASPDPVYSSSYNSTNGLRIPTTTLTTNFSRVSVETWAEKHHAPSANHLKPKPRLTPKIEGHLASYETKLHDSHAEQDERNANVNADKINLPKIDISSRRELFEKEQKAQFQRSNVTKKTINLTENAEAPASIKERLSYLEKRNDEPKEMTPNKPNRYSGDFSGVRDRFSHTENGQFVTIEPKAPKIDVPVVPLKERLLNLESSMVTETSPLPQNAKLEHRAKKMTEPKPIAINKLNEDTLKVIDNNNDSVTSSPVHVDEQPHHMKDDEDSGINSDDLQSSLASQQSQPQQLADEVAVIAQMVTALSSPHIDKPMEPVPVARKPEVLPRRQITPDLVKITSNLNIEDDLLQSQDEIDDEADNSVSSPNASPSTITKHFVNLTIKSVLVDSHDIVKASTLSSPSSSTFDLVVENQSVERAISSGQAATSNENNCIVDTIPKTVANHNLTVDIVEPVLTETLKLNAVNNTNQTNSTAEIAIVDSTSLPFSQTIAINSNNQSDQCTSLGATGTIEKQSPGVESIDGDPIQKHHESTEFKNERIKCQIVGVLEKNKIDVLTVSSNENQSPKSPRSPVSPSKSTNKSPSKTKNIFDFIKRNLLNESTPAANSESIDGESIDQISNFYVSLNEAKQISEIDQLLDNELDKLSDTNETPTN